LYNNLYRINTMSTYNDASLIYYPSGYKAGKAYSLKPTDGSGDLTFTRASTATRVNSAGLIESVATGVPRIDFTGGGCGKLLLEPQRTNVVLHSGDLSQTQWSKSLYTLTSTSAIQGLTATRITKDATNNGSYKGSGTRNLVQSGFTFASGIKTISWLIRKGNTDKVSFLSDNILVGALTNVNCEFNFNTKTFTNVSLGLSASFENPQTDVYKIILTFNDTGTSTSKAIWIAPINASNSTVDGGYLDFAFAQWELGSYATSYINTTSTAVTRVADNASKSGISSLIGQTQGTIFFELVIGASDSSSVSRNIGGISDGTSSNRIEIYRFNNTIQYDNITLGANQFSGIVFTLANFNTPLKIAISYSLNNVKTFVNGVLVNTDVTALIPACSNLQVGVGRGGSAPYGGLVQSSMIFPTAKSDAELIALTTI